MNVSQRRRWWERIAYLAGGATCLLFIIWGVAIAVTERTASFFHAPLPASVSIVAPRHEPAIRRARDHAQAMMSERQIPGLSVAVAVEGEIVWSEAFGYADRERHVPATPETQFRVASLSKLFAAAALAQLYERGRLDLDAPIQTYVPGFPDKGYTITARQLAGHRAGIRDYRDDSEAINTRHYRSVSESLEKFKDDPLKFAPDSDFCYSGYGYVLLSAAIEGASGEDFLSYTRHHVFEPLHMEHTTADFVDTRSPRQSCFYDNVTPFSSDGSMVVSPYNDFSCKWAAGGFLSTAEDLVRFGLAHIVPMGKGFLKPETLELLFIPRTTRAGVLGFGLGWMTARDLHLRRVHFNFGAASGGTAVLAIYPEQRVCVAMVGNLGHARFPFGRLMGVVNPFLADPARYVFGGGMMCLLIGGLVTVRKRLRGRGKMFAQDPEFTIHDKD
jgi:CubicO group peptidase (beta-lactamase class C family)